MKIYLLTANDSDSSESIEELANREDILVPHDLSSMHVVNNKKYATLNEMFPPNCRNRSHSAFCHPLQSCSEPECIVRFVHES